jgi:polyketide biosynthesis acyl carrier protein
LRWHEEVVEMGSADKGRIIEALKTAIGTVLPDVSPDRIHLDGRLRDLGANSVDRAEILTLTIEALSLKMPLVELAKAEDIAGLVEIFEEWLAK